MPTGIVDAGAKTELYGIGKGSAQVFDTDILRDNIKLNRAERFNREQSKVKRDKANEDDAYGAISDLSKIDIYAGHRQEFADQQAKLRDFTIKNIGKIRSGDAATVMQFQDIKNSISNAANLSKNFREQKEAVGKEMEKDIGAYRPESIDYFVNSGRDADGKMEFEFDPTKIRKNLNLDDDVTKNVRPIVEDMAKGKSYTYENSDGTRTLVDINNFGDKDAETILQDRLKHPEIAEQAAYNYNHLSPKEQDQYSDYQDYYIERQKPKLLVNQNKTVRQGSPDAESKKAQIEMTTSENQMTFKTSKPLSSAQQAMVNLSEDAAKKLSPEQQAQRTEWKNQNQTEDVPMLAKATHTKPIVAKTAITDKMRTLSGDKIPAGTDIHDAEYGQTGVMPFVKSGKNKGNLITDKELKEEEAKGNVEWTVATTGTLTYGSGTKAKKVSIVRPTSEIRSPVSKQVDIDALQKVATQRNEQSRGGFPEVTSQAAYDALPKGSKYKHNGKVLTKK